VPLCAPGTSLSRSPESKNPSSPSPPFSGVKHPDRTQKRKNTKNTKKQQQQQELQKLKHEVKHTFLSPQCSSLTLLPTTNKPGGVCAHQERAAAKLNDKSENGKAVSCPCRGEAQDILPMRGMAMVTAAKASNTSLK
jgi:hypothetical protein